ncbi:MAG: hypothetical protein ACYCZH_10880 [Sulfuriferula sp.]
MKIRNLIPIVSFGIFLGSVTPVFAEPAFNVIPAMNNAMPLLLASRDDGNDARDNGRDRAEQRGDGGNRRQQNEVRRDDRPGRFGYGFERRQERDQQTGNDGRGRQ